MEEEINKYKENNMISWIKGRLKERTSLDGGALIAVGLVVLFLGPFATWAAYAAIVYGAWTMWKSEGSK
jgi:hypothetical protein|tara:strand:- start:281 stop:487 length:207 start_codon:yes stop_codon:yes gene_type:complete